MLKKILLTGAVIALMSVGAQAADIVEPAAYDWTGPYIGIQGGYAWGKNDLSANSTGDVVAEFAAAVIDGDDGSFDLDGFVGGGHAGLNWQMDSLVLGLEGDIEFADLDDDIDIFDLAGNLAGQDKVQVDWLGSIRLRGGFAVDRALFYATGGLAVGGAELEADDDFGEHLVDERDTKWGWTIGAGLEYAFTDDLSARVEYRYTDLGNVKAHGEDENVDDKADLAFHAVRVGLSWHFQGM
jgi:outer membrane immunogenic protein